jgi:hypothetical protein
MSVQCHAFIGLLIGPRGPNRLLIPETTETHSKDRAKGDHVTGGAVKHWVIETICLDNV